MSNKVLMIGAGGVATVCAFKIAQNTDVFGEFMIASHHREKCVKLVDAIHAKGYKMPIETAEVDADSVDQLKSSSTVTSPTSSSTLPSPIRT